MSDEVIKVELLAKMFLAGAQNLDLKKEWINELNVFPVPDGDTGTNMTMTIMSAAKDVKAITDMNLADLCKAISTGSLRGARGNSGVILSQLLRGFTKGIKEEEKITIPVIAKAMTRATDTAYKAVMKPKEGTILTVARGMSEKAEELAAESESMTMQEFLQKIIEHGDYVLSQTPELLPVLKQAGVVDSGGQGLMVVLKGAFDAYCGKEIEISIEASERPAAAPINQEIDTADIKFGYCTEFIILLEKPFGEKDENELKAYLESIGDSIVCVADDEIVKIHVHTNDPGLAFQKGLTYGQLTKMKVDNMRIEHHEKLIKDASRIAEEEKKEKEKEIPNKPYGFISVCVGEGLEEIFKSLGIDEIISGGQTMNPSTEDFLQAIDKIHADNIIILPNNKNIILAAEQAAKLTKDKNIVVVPTKTIPQGVTAMINFNPDASAEENKEVLTEEIQHVKTGQVTYAVRNTTIDDKVICENDIMGIGDSRILSVGKTIADTTLDMIDQMADEDSVLISIYYGEGMTEEDASLLADEVTKRYPHCDVELNMGGQAVYYYIVSVE